MVDPAPSEFAGFEDLRRNLRMVTAQRDNAIAQRDSLAAIVREILRDEALRAAAGFATVNDWTDRLTACTTPAV